MAHGRPDGALGPDLWYGSGSADADYYHPYYHYGRSHNRWGDYYGYPWWYYDNWWWQPDGNDAPSVPVETGTRHIWGGGGGGGKGWSFVLPPTPPAAEAPRQDSGTTVQPDGGQTEEKETDDGHIWDSEKKKGF